MIQSSRRVDAHYMASWFHYEPIAKPAPKKMPRLQPRTDTAKTART